MNFQSDRAVNVLDPAILISRLVWKMENMAECIHLSSEDIEVHIREVHMM